MKNFFKKKNKGRKVPSMSKGFTIIETMIAVSLFTIITVTGMGTLLNANLLHQKSQNMRSIMDNLSFIMEDMSRNLRTGYDYHCGDSNIESPASCAFGRTIFFEEAHATGPSVSTDQWGYKIESVLGGPFNISKSIDGGATWVQLNPAEVVIDSVSGFSVLGAEPPVINPIDGSLSGDTQQPFVIIKLVGNIVYKNNIITPFSLQTSVSQRIIDI